MTTTVKKTVKKTVKIETAIEAIEAAGHKAYITHDDVVRFYDPRKRGKFLTIRGGFCDNNHDDYVRTDVTKGCSGAFCAEIRGLLESLMS